MVEDNLMFNKFLQNKYGIEKSRELLSYIIVLNTRKQMA